MRIFPRSEPVYGKYLGIHFTIAKDGTAHVDYPNKIRGSVDALIKNSGKKIELRSDPSRYQVHYPKNSIEQLLDDIETVLQAINPPGGCGATVVSESAGMSATSRVSNPDRKIR